MMDGKQILSDELMETVTQLAYQQHRQPAEVLQEAVRQYAAAYRLERFSEKMAQRAQEKGIREEDIPELVQRVRRETQQRGQ
jgi:predicted transcriptional regulator